MRIGTNYKIIANYGWSPVTLTDEKYTELICKTQKDAEEQLLIYKRKNPNVRFHIEEWPIEIPPYGDWRDVYG